MNLQNPIFLGIIGAILTYVYLYYVEKRKFDNKEVTQISVPLYKPLLIGLLVWFLISQFFDSSSPSVADDVETDGDDNEELSPISSDEAIESVLEDTFIPPMSCRSIQVRTDYGRF